jgi:hypothetical protein
VAKLTGFGTYDPLEDKYLKADLCGRLQTQVGIEPRRQ